MIQLTGATSKQLLAVECGHLVVFQFGLQAGGKEPTLALRVQDDLDTDVAAVVLFSKGKPPRYLRLQTNPVCVDLGWAAKIQVAIPPEGFTPSVDAPASGSLLIMGKATCVVCEVPNAPHGLATVYVDVSGRVAQGADPRWGITKWSLGVNDVSGAFVELYRPPAA